MKPFDNPNFSLHISERHPVRRTAPRLRPHLTQGELRQLRQEGIRDHGGQARRHQQQHHPPQGQRQRDRGGVRVRIL